MEESQFPLGKIIAERRVKLFGKAGEERIITVSLGAPVVAGSLNEEVPLFRCPLQIVGLDHDERVFAPAGGDSFVALKFGLDFIGDLLRGGSCRLELQNRTPSDTTSQDYWIWQYRAEGTRWGS